MILLAVLLLAAACGDIEISDAASVPETDDAAYETAGTSPTDDPAPAATTAPSGAIDGGDRSITQLAIANLAERLGIEGADETTVVLTEDVTWRNGSLGCPEPGMSYTQALVDGFRVILELEGVQYAYHSGRGQAPFLCASPDDDGTTRNT